MYSSMLKKNAKNVMNYLQRQAADSLGEAGQNLTVEITKLQQSRQPTPTVEPGQQAAEKHRT